MSVLVLAKVLGSPKVPSRGGGKDGAHVIAGLIACLGG